MLKSDGKFSTREALSEKPTVAKKKTLLESLL